MILAFGLAACGPEVDPCAGQPYEIRYEDRDRDGRGNRERPSITCPALQPVGYVLIDGDCDDTDAAVGPGRFESCDGLDNDCDGLVDEGLPEQTYYYDLDRDGFGSGAVTACDPPPLAVSVAGDCDDGDDTVHPGALERCDGVDNDCDGLSDLEDDTFDETSVETFWVDADGDGFGDPHAPVLGCSVPAGAVDNDGDCDDSEALVHPGVLEVCNGRDDDCDNRIDDSDPGIVVQTQQRWYLDADQDGFGDATDAIVTCTTPWFRVLDASDCDDSDPAIHGPDTTFWHEDLDGDGFGSSVLFGPSCFAPSNGSWVPLGDEDCDDVRDAVNPGATEVCDGRDDDCDGLVDDEDPDIDPATTPSYQIDADGDGFAGEPFLSCTEQGPTVTTGGDCDDTDPLIAPDMLEICNGVDDDCNGYTDDDDPFLDPTQGGRAWFRDADGDGHGDPFTARYACEQPDGRVRTPSDCDDTNPQLGPPAMWWPDQDGDQRGAGVIFGPSCAPPSPNFVIVGDEDCDDTEPTIFPGVYDACEDGLDQDCDGIDPLCPRASCREILEDGLSTGDGVYTLAPLGPHVQVYCDMTTDGGGWTLVSSSNWPVDDGATGYDAALQGLQPTDEMAGIWDGLRDVAGIQSDIRFACRENLDDTVMEVDLVFYATHWYYELTSGTDEEVCFNEQDGQGYDVPAPERKNLLTGSVREAGNDWGFGYLEGEDGCASRDDFTVDFDDRGMDSNQADGTDWGEDDEAKKCGRTGRGEAWYIFVR